MDLLQGDQPEIWA